MSSANQEIIHRQLNPRFGYQNNIFYYRQKVTGQSPNLGIELTKAVTMGKRRVLGVLTPKRYRFWTNTNHVLWTNDSHVSIHNDLMNAEKTDRIAQFQTTKNEGEGLPIIHVASLLNVGNLLLLAKYILNGNPPEIQKITLDDVSGHLSYPDSINQIFVGTVYQLRKSIDTIV